MRLSVNKTLFTLIVVISCFFLTSCVKVVETTTLFRCKDLSYSESLQSEIVSKLDLQPVINTMAFELCGDTEQRMCTPIVITDVVDIKSLKPRRIGMLMSEMLRNSFNNVCCNKIFQAEFSRYFKLNQNGLVVLTRDASEIKNEGYPFSEAIVGTYNITKDRLYIFFRRINIHTGQVSRFTTREISFQCIGDTVIKSVK
ncbi:MAG: FlgO family outer membrane protein [Thermodesulfovibrionales bacterium]|nr:FlgO family outer membrane protein [Thermodesulfovibrionales bacterium]